MTKNDQRRLAEAFRAAHRGPLLLLPNAWDAMSARLFEAAGLECKPQPATLKPADEALAWATQWIQSLPERDRDRPLIMINPGAREPNRNWTAENWNALLAELQNRFSPTILINGRAEDAHIANPPLESQIHFLDDLPLDRLIALRGQLGQWLGGETLHGTLWRAGLPKTMLPAAA